MLQGLEGTGVPGPLCSRVTLGTWGLFPGDHGNFLTLCKHPGLAQGWLGGAEVAASR